MKRDIGQELLEGIKAIKKGQGLRATVDLPSDVKAIRSKIGLSQSAFAGLLGVSIRTLQEWEQGRRTPKGPAQALLRVADRHPAPLLGFRAFTGWVALESDPVAAWAFRLAAGCRSP